MSTKSSLRFCVALALAAAIGLLAQPAAPAAQPVYDLLLRGGHVLDDKNHIDGVMDVAIKDGKIARVAAHIPGECSAENCRRQGPLCDPRAD